MTNDRNECLAVCQEALGADLVSAHPCLIEIRHVVREVKFFRLPLRRPPLLWTDIEGSAAGAVHFCYTHIIDSRSLVHD
jgi:hypothetical protein